MSVTRPVATNVSTARHKLQSPANASRRNAAIALVAILMIGAHLALRFAGASAWSANVPLWVALAVGGIPLIIELGWHLVTRGFGADLLAGISIVTSVLLEQYLAGALVVLMLSGGEALENFAVRSASSVLDALARRTPSTAHRTSTGKVAEVPLGEVRPGDQLLVLPHEICPVDGRVVEGHGVMDESYLTGEPFMMSKTPGSKVLSGSINGDTALTIEAEKLAVDSRYAKIMDVMRAADERRPNIRRLGDRLGAFYTPLALSVALIAWLVSGEADRFLAVLVVATPCPLLIAIPVCIIGAVSLSARRGIIIKDPAVLEQIDRCTTVILDKTGTLTYGKPELVAQHVPQGFDADRVLALAASLERYSKHPLSAAVVEAGHRRSLVLLPVDQIHEPPGAGLQGLIAGQKVFITNRRRLLELDPSASLWLPERSAGLECCVAIDGRGAAIYQFHDEPRSDGKSFVQHLGPRHHVRRVMLVSGDRESEVRYLAGLVGIDEVLAGQSPEQKLAVVRSETARSKTLFLGDGINDAPALTAASVGVAFGQNSDITAEAAGAVIMDSTLARVDELMHIGRRMRTIALQCALGGMALSLVGMSFAAAGYLPPVAGAVAQEVIDLAAVLNALRVAFPVKRLSDY